MDNYKVFNVPDYDESEVAFLDSSEPARDCTEDYPEDYPEDCTDSCKIIDDFLSLTDDMIEDIITAMSKMFRYSLYSDMIVTLSSEIDMLRQYFLITCYRFPDKYVLKEEIDENTLSYRVPSMILQPLVENCIKHAFVNMPAGRKNEITVKARFTEEGLLKLSVSDNGCGMSEEAMEHLRESVFSEDDVETHKDSIGVKNIYERVKLFDKMNEMRFYSSPGEYTKVELVLHSAFINK